MRLMLARGWLPALVAYSDQLPPDVGSASEAFFVIVNPKYRDDAGIHQHELEHVVQWYASAAMLLCLALAAWFQDKGGEAVGFVVASVGMHGFLYRRWRRFRLWAESAAYARQMLFPDRKGGRLSLDEASRRLCSERYDLGLSSQEAQALIDRR